MLDPIPLDPVPAPVPSPPAPPEPVAAAPAAPAPDLSAPIAALQAQVAALDTIAKKFASVGNDLIAAGSAGEAMEKVRDALLDKVDASKPSFQFQLIRPFVQRLAKLADSIGDYRKSPPKDEAGFASSLESISTQMAELLSLHGVLEVRPKEGDALDPRCHFVAETRPTADQAKHEKVAELQEHGYQYIGQHDRSGNVTGTLIRPARVATWKHDPTLSTT